MLVPDHRPGWLALSETNERSDGQREVFLCHASGDKREIVSRIFKHLEAKGISCWYDDAEIGWGQGITESVDDGLAKSKFVLVVLSERFLARRWPRRELYAALKLEIEGGETKVLPLLVGTAEQRARILARLPLLAEKKFIEWDGNPQTVYEGLVPVLKKAPR